MPIAVRSPKVLPVFPESDSRSSHEPPTKVKGQRRTPNPDQRWTTPYSLVRILGYGLPLILTLLYCWFTRSHLDTTPHPLNLTTVSSTCTSCPHERYNVNIHPSFSKSLAHQISPCSSAFKMASTPTINPNQGALSWANNLRIASLTMLTYEYVVRCIFLALLRTYIRPVISSHSLPNSGFTKQQVDAGKEAHARLRRSRFNRNGS